MALDRPDDDFDDFDGPGGPGGRCRAAMFPRGGRSRPSRVAARSTTRCSGPLLRVRRLMMAARRPTGIVRGGIRLMPRTGRRPRTFTSPRNGPPTYSMASQAVAAGIGTARAFPARPSSRRAGTTRRSWTLWSTSRGDLTCRPSIKNRNDRWVVQRDTRRCRGRGGRSARVGRSGPAGRSGRARRGRRTRRNRDQDKYEIARAGIEICRDRFADRIPREHSVRSSS